MWVPHKIVTSLILIDIIVIVRKFLLGHSVE